MVEVALDVEVLRHVIISERNRSTNILPSHNPDTAFASARWKYYEVEVIAKLLRRASGLSYRCISGSPSDSTAWGGILDQRGTREDYIDHLKFTPAQCVHVSK